jgi:ankyrin repeat protein
VAKTKSSIVIDAHDVFCGNIGAILVLNVIRSPTNISKGTPMNDDFMALIRLVASGDTPRVKKIVEARRDLVRAAAVEGATRSDSRPYFLQEIKHYLYAGDTALHIAGTAFKSDIARILIDLGANCAAKNRRGAEPLHYASDSNIWNPSAQAATIECLIQSGADPNSTDKSGVAPIHRAVRTRCAPAVQALLSGGAEPNLRNKSGSTPLHLAVQNTGKGGSGSDHAIEQQKQIIVLLMKNGANLQAKDGKGKTVAQAAISSWIRELLAV